MRTRPARRSLLREAEAQEAGGQALVSSGRGSHGLHAWGGKRLASAVGRRREWKPKPLEQARPLRVTAALPQSGHVGPRPSFSETLSEALVLGAHSSVHPETSRCPQLRRYPGNPRGCRSPLQLVSASSPRPPTMTLQAPS